MKPRATKALASYPDRRLLPAIAEGMALLAEHARVLEASVATLRSAEEVRGAAPIRLLAEEEAAKFLILLDVVRSPKDQGLRARQLARFHDHLAKGIYAEVYSGSPATFGEVRRFVDVLRRSHYLDGPNDVDWIFRNEIESRREDRLYVDFVETDEGRTWISPARLDDLDVLGWPQVVRVAEAMERLGLASEAALSIVATRWRNLALDDSTHWQTIRRLNEQTIEQLIREGPTPSEVAEEDVSLVVDSWCFPLFGLELKPIPVDLDVLRSQQNEALEW